MIASDVFAAALARSYRNRGDAVAQDSTELLARLSLILRRFYAQGSGLNPAVFSQRASLPWDSNGWAIPSDCDTIILLKYGTADVLEVPVDDLQAEPAEACVYRLGGRLYPAGNPNDPQSVALVAFYTIVPATLATTADAMPAGWPAQFDDMLVVELAVWLAKKDGRTDELPGLEQEQTAWAGLWREWLSRPSLNTVRRFGQPQLVPSPNVGTARVERQ